MDHKNLSVNTATLTSFEAQTKRRGMQSTLAVFLALVSHPAIVSATDTEYSRRTLKGIKAVAVLVEELKEEVPNGLTKGQLQTDVELRLRKAGITVIPPTQSNQAAAPFLYVRINSMQLPTSGQYVYAIGIELNQVVRIARDAKITSLATTWDKGGTGCTSRPGSIRDSVAEYVDKFITAYFSVNSRPWRPY